MDGLPSSIERVTTEFARLPGVGRRTAQRYALHLLRAAPSVSIALSEAIRTARESVVPCEKCHAWSDTPVCAICSDGRRDPKVLCVVEQPTDVLAIERTGEYRGLYFVLGGALSPIDGVGPEQLHIDELDARIATNEAAELVLATSPTMSGEATASWLADRYSGRVTITRPVSGLPVGVDLERADELTLGRALTGRREMQ